MISNFFTPGIVFLLTLVFGLWLSRTGKPYNGILFNIHKLVALGAVIVTAMQVYTMRKSLDVQALIVILLVVAGICVIALFASGAFMSIGNVNYQVMKTTHHIAPVLAAIAMALTIYLLAGNPW